VLIGGLPPEAATHRSKAFPPVEEMLATLIERHDEWSQALLKAALNHKRVTPPGQMRFQRPGEEPERKLVSDPRAIAAWFAKNVGGR
jgi:hypothetical protein